MRTSTLFLFVAVTTFAACGGGDDADSSGLDPSAPVGTLSQEDATTMCEWSTTTQGGPGTVHECGDGVTVEIESVGECVTSLADFSDCGLTVGQMEACTLELADNPCGFGAACAPLFECF